MNSKVKNRALSVSLITEDIIISLFSIILALLVGAIIVFFLGNSPVEAYGALLSGAFGSVRSIAGTLTKTVPLIFTGLAVAIAFRCGLFNIGAEGQLYVGSIAGAIVGLSLPFLPAVILLPLSILSGMLVGFLWGGIPGFLKARFQTHEVIVTVMLNYVAIFLTSYLVNYPFKSDGMVAQTDMLPSAAQLPKIIQKTQLSAGLFIAIAAVFLVYWFLWKTSWGYEIRAVGENPSAAEAGGIGRKKNTFLAMALSGSIASLAGITHVHGIYGRFIEGYSPGFGFTGIAVAVLGRNHPFGVVLSAILFGALDAGALRMDRTTEISSDLVIVIQGLVILFVAAPGIIRSISTRLRGGK